MVKVFEEHYQTGEGGLEFKMDLVMWPLEARVTIPPFRVYLDTLNGGDKKMAICAYIAMVRAIRGQAEKR